MRHRFVGSAVALALALAGSACAGPPEPELPPRPPPALSSIPPELAALRVHVHQQKSPPETPLDAEEYRTMPGWTRALRNAFEVTLARAGYVVVLGRHDPSDVVARVVASWEGEHDAVATLTLEAGGQVVGQFSAVVPRATPFRHPYYYMEDGSAALVEQMGRAPAVLALARASVERRTLRVAAPK